MTTWNFQNKLEVGNVDSEILPGAYSLGLRNSSCEHQLDLLHEEWLQPRAWPSSDSWPEEWGWQYCTCVLHTTHVIRATFSQELRWSDLMPF